MTIVDHYVILHSFFKYEGHFSPVGSLEEAVALAKENKIKSEIIGNWLYCYANDLVGVQLLSVGFWFSHKHNAYVFSGDDKELVADEETLDEIRARLGNQRIELA